MNKEDNSLLILSVVVVLYLYIGGASQLLAADNEIWMDQSGATANIDLRAARVEVKPNRWCRQRSRYAD